VVEVDHNTLLQWLVNAAEQLPACSQHFLLDVRVRSLALWNRQISGSQACDATPNSVRFA
jgi:hypothetical protein